MRRKQPVLGGATCICQARKLANKRAAIQTRTVALADREKVLAEGIAAADAEDEEPHYFGHGLQR